VVAGLLVVLALSASSLDDARAAYAGLEYGKCREAARAALAAPASRPDRVEAHRLAGLCAAALGDGDGAREAFKRMLLVDRDAALPEGLSPRFTSAFREAKGELIDVPPTTFTVESDARAGRVRVVRIAVVDPADVVAKIAHRGEGGVTSPAVRKAARLELEVPGEGRVELIGLDAAGGEVVVVALAPLDAPAADAPPVPTAAAVEEEAGTPWLLVGAGAAAGVVLVGGAVAAGGVWALQPPSRAAFATDVVFGD
jgi:hypothetical protein